MAITDADIRRHVFTTFGASNSDNSPSSNEAWVLYMYDVQGIVNDLIGMYGLVDPSLYPDHKYWAIVQDNETN